MILPAVLGLLSAIAEPRACAGNLSVSTFQLNVRQPNGGQERSVRGVNAVPAGYRIVYRPGNLPPDLKRDARMALVMAPVPASGDPAPPLSVVGLKPVDAPAEWVVPFRVGMLVLVLGPQGLDEKRISNLITKDEELFTALADYADQTEDLELTIEAFRDTLAEEEEPAPAPRTASEQALYALLRALSPSVASYSPLGPGRRSAPATMMGKVADGFFANAGGVIPGGGILPEMKNWLMPDTEFRAVFVEQQRNDLALCAQRPRVKTRNKIAYLWARRIPDAKEPALALTAEAHLPIGVRSPLRIRTTEDQSLLARVQSWTLKTAAGQAVQPVTARLSADGRGLDLDLRKFAGDPGQYQLQGMWDFNTLTVDGSVSLYRTDDLSHVEVSSESGVRLAENSGPVTLVLSGADFQFVDKVTWKRADARIPPAADAPFFLPEGRRRGPQTRLEVDIDTTNLRAGQYALALYQAGGASREMPVQVQPAPPEPPRITSLPLRVNTGEQKLVLTGIDLDKIEQIECDGAKITLAPAVRGATRREATVMVPAAARKGDRYSITLRVVADARTFPIDQAIEVLGSRPVLARGDVSLPDDLGVDLLPGELPAGSFATFSLRAEGVEGAALLHLACLERDRTIEALTLRPATLVVSFDPGRVGLPGCTLQADVETEASGRSDAIALGRVVRLPRIDEFTLTDERVPDGSYVGQLKGEGLEWIERTGWDASNGLPAGGLPRPVAAQGAKQTLRVAMPWPSPSPRARLYVWLRGEKTGRATRLRN